MRCLSPRDHLTVLLLLLSSLLSLAGCNPGEREQELQNPGEREQELQNPGEREQKRQEEESLSDWTPENIAKYPKEYLRFCGRQYDEVMQDLRANEIRIRQNLSAIQQRHDASHGKAEEGRKAIEELKTLYREAEPADAFPVEWRGTKRDKDWVRRNIVALDKQIASEEKAVTTMAASARKLDAELIRNQGARAQAQQQKSEGETALVQLQLQDLTKELERKLLGMRSVLEGMIVGAAEETSIVTLDELVSEKEASVDDAAFDAIMQR